jgi:hypothetical protein
MGKETSPGVPSPGDRQPTHEGAREGSGPRPSGTGTKGTTKGPLIGIAGQQVGGKK